LIETKNSGLRLDFESFLSELATIWSDGHDAQWNVERIRRLLEDHFSDASKIKNRDQMVAVFAKAKDQIDLPERGAE